MYIPPAEICPPDADQVTPVFVVPVTVAIICCCPPACKLAAVGESVTAIVLGAGVGLGTATATTAVSDTTGLEVDLWREGSSVAVMLYVPADKGAV